MEKGIRVLKAEEEVIRIPYTPQKGHFLKKARLRRKRSGELKFKEISSMLDFLDYSQAETATLLAVDPSTISRWKNKNEFLDKFRSSSLFELDEIILEGIRIFGSEEIFREWLETNNTALGDQKPIDFIRSETPNGLDLVRDSLAALSYGNYM